MKPIFWLFAVLASSLTYAQNSYHTVVEINREARWVRTTADPGPGGAVLLYQHKGATLGADGSVTNPNGAGQYDLNRAVRRAGDTLFLLNPIVHGYNLAHTQLVSHPAVDSLVINEVLAPAETFDGNRGGILFLAARRRIDLGANARLNAVGTGYRGGRGQQANSDCNRFTSADGGNYALGNWRGAAKGEGVAVVPADRAAGRTAAGNGGGGGNDHNAGGGGGANRSAGGAGARNIVGGLFNNSCRGNFPGRGGRALMDNPNLLFFGGGGGAGHANNTTEAAGGNGGGLIVVWAPVVTMHSACTLDVSGADAGAVNGDGGGGGGAGGAILLRADELQGTVFADLEGGRGADVNNPGDRCFGPGGGGAGGTIFVDLTGSIRPTLALNLAGGAFGQRLGSSDCGPNEEPAGTGQAGSSRIRLGTGAPFPALSLTTADICGGDTLRLRDESRGATRSGYVLSPASPDLTLSVNGDELTILTSSAASGTFQLIQTVFAGNDAFPGDTLTITARPVPTLATADLRREDETVTVTITEPTNFFGLRYDFGDGTVVDTTALMLTHAYSAGGRYPVVVTLLGSGCGNLVDTVRVVDLPQFAAARLSDKDRSGCAPFTLTLNDISSGFYTGRAWDLPGATPAPDTAAAQTVTYARPGDYVVTLRLLGALGADTIATQSIRVLPTPTADFDFAIDTATVVFTNRSQEIDSVRWFFGDGDSSRVENPVHSYASAGSYSATQIVSSGSCRDTLSRLITIEVVSDVEELARRGVRVFPNPVRGTLRLSGEALFTGYFDLLGRYREVVPGRKLTLEDLPAGRYAVVVLSGSERYVVPIIKQ